MKFTQESITDAACPSGRKDALFFDESLPGFGIRVTPAGKNFLVQYRTAIGPRRMALGRFGELTVPEARKLARAALGRVAEGRDPYQERADNRKAEIEAAAERKARLSLRELIKIWDDSNLTECRPTYRSSVTGSLRRHLSAALDQKADELTADDAADALVRVSQDAGPVAANRLLSYGRAVYGWGIKQRKFKLRANPFAGLAAPGSETSRERVLSDKELGMIWRAADKIGWPGGPFTRVLMLTIARRNEVAGIRRSELSDDCSAWTLPAERAKNGKAHVTHLSAPARDILLSLQQIGDSEFVFTTTGESHVSGFSKFKAALDTEITEKNGGEAIPQWQFHDFRRSAVTWIAKAGFPPHVADRLLNHVGGSISGVAAIYQRHQFEAERTAALEAWAAHLTACGTNTVAGSNVVELRRA